jgi:hypothetical protein
LKKRKKKRGRKRKASRVSLNKGEVNTLRGEKQFNFKNILFDVSPSSLHHHTILKTLSKIIEKVFLALFGPSFNLAIYSARVPKVDEPYYLCYHILSNLFQKEAPTFVIDSGKAL